MHTHNKLLLLLLWVYQPYNFLAFFFWREEICMNKKFQRFSACTLRCIPKYNIYIYTMYLIYSIHTAMLCLSVGLTLAYSSVSADCACLSDSQTGCSFACLSVGAFCFVFTHFVMAFSVLFSRGFCFVVFNILFGFMGIFMGGRVVNSKWIQHEHTRQYYIMICAGH